MPPIRLVMQLERHSALLAGGWKDKKETSPHAAEPDHCPVYAFHAITIAAESVEALVAASKTGFWTSEANIQGRLASVLRLNSPRESTARSEVEVVRT